MADRILRARLEAETTAFTARIAAAQQQLERMAIAPRAAQQGMRHLQGALSALATEATGMTGPLGRVAVGLSTIAVGTPAVMGVLAALGAVGLGMRLLRRDAHEATKGLEAFASAAEFTAKQRAEALERVVRAAAAAPEAQQARLMAEVEQAGQRRAQIAREIAAHEREIARQQRRILPDAEAIAKHQEHINRLRREYNALLQGSNELLRKHAMQLREITVVALPNLLALQDTMRQLAIPTVQPALRPLPFEPEVRRDLAEELARQFGFGDIARLRLAGVGRAPQEIVREVFEPRTTLAQQVLDEIRQRADEMAVAMAELSQRFRAGEISAHELAEAQRVLGVAQRQAALSSAELILSIGNMISAFARGPSVAGFLQVAGGIASFLGPQGRILGAALMAGGGIISALQDRHRPLPVRDEAARAELAALRRDLERERQDRLISITIVDPLGRPLRELRYELDRASRRDAIPRIP